MYGDFDCYFALNLKVDFEFHKNDNLIKVCFLCEAILCFQRLKMTSIHKYTLSFLDFRMFVLANRLIGLDQMCFVTICHSLLILKKISEKYQLFDVFTWINQTDFQDELNNLLIICYSSWVYFFIVTSHPLTRDRDFSGCSGRGFGSLNN